MIMAIPFWKDITTGWAWLQEAQPCRWKVYGYFEVMVQSKKLVVLVIEDEPLIRMDNALVLEEAGFDVIEAADADEAIAILEKTPAIWAIFTDIDMPGSMDGLRLAHAVKDRWPPIHIFVTSGHRAIEANELPAGGRFFAKPCDSKALIAAFCEVRDLSHRAP